MSKILVVLILAVLLAGCGDDAINHRLGETSQVVVLTAMSENEVLIQGQTKKLTLAQFEAKAQEYAAAPELYSFVIQSGSGHGLAEKLRAILLEAGVQSRHVAIASEDT